MSLLTKLGAKIRKDGWSSLLVAVGERVGTGNSAIWFSRSLVECDVCEDDNQDLTLLPLKDIENWLKLLQSEFGFAWLPGEIDVARRYEHPAVLVRRNGENVGYVKIGVTRAHISDFDTSIQLPAEMAFIYDTFIHPAHRGQGLAADAIRFACKKMSLLGYKAIACHIPVWNIASIKTYTMVGFRARKRVFFVRLLGITVYSSSPERLLKKMTSNTK